MMMQPPVPPGDRDPSAEQRRDLLAVKIGAWLGIVLLAVGTGLITYRQTGDAGSSLGAASMILLAFGLGILYAAADVAVDAHGSHHLDHRPPTGLDQ
jgi:hypothetical protein